MAESGDRTLPASERRRQQARDDGQAPMSREVVTFASLAAAAAMLTWGTPPLTRALALRLHGMLLDMAAGPGAALQTAGLALVWTVGPVAITVLLAGGAAVMLQTGGLLHGSALVPDLARLDPRRGLKRIFSLDAAVETLKSLAKAAMLGWAVWHAVMDAVPDAMAAPFWQAGALLDRVGFHLRHIVLVVLGCQAAIAAADLGWVRYRFAARLRMSRQELTDEHKEAEGDPAHKNKLRALRRARARRRMMAAVPKATVIITNPTHYAVALVYERGTQAAPRVVAKGMDEVAARIRALAKQHGVPLVANPPLARALHELNLDAEVPAEHFKAVAEIIAYVWRLRGKASGAR